MTVIKNKKLGKRKRSYRRSKNKVDQAFLTLVVGIVFIGLLIIFSAGVAVSQAKYGHPYHFFQHQLLYGIIPGLLVMGLTSRLPYHYWQKLAPVFLVVSLGTLVAVLISQAGLELKGARRWLYLGPFAFQPAEMVKLSLIIYLASWLTAKEKVVKSFSDGLIPFVIVLGAVAILLILQPDVGSLGAIAFIALSMFYLAGGSLRHIFFLIIAGLVALMILIKLEPYRLNRFLAFIHPEIDPQGISWQVQQAAIAIGHGGLWGVGPGHSYQKFNYLPEVVGDSIFAIVAEELGLVGAGVLLFLFLALVLRGFYLARRAPDKFAALLVAGISLWIAWQTLINIMAIVGLIPLTGITLPFISYGASSLIFLLAGAGIVLNVSRAIK